MSRFLTAKTVTTNVAIVGLGLLNSILLSRLLGPAGRGEIGAAMLWPVLLVAITSFGFIPATLFFAGREAADTEAVLANAAGMGLVQGTVAIIIGYICLPALLPHQSERVINVARAYLLVVPISLLTQYGISVLQARLHIGLFNLLRMIIPAGYLGGVIVLSLLKKVSLSHVVFLHLSLTLIAMLAVYFCLFKVGVRLSFRCDWPLWKEMLRYGAKVLAGDLSQLGNLRLDQTVIAAWLPPAELGLYLASVSAAQTIQILSTAVRQVLVPSMVRASSQTSRLELLKRTLARYSALSLGATLAVAVILPFGIPLIFGPSFRGAILPAEILLVGFFFLSAKDVLAGGAQALGDPWLGSRAEILALGITAGLLAMLLPRYGILGAAIAAMAAYAAALFFLARALCKAYQIRAKHLFVISHASFHELMSIVPFFRPVRPSGYPLAQEGILPPENPVRGSIN